MWSSTLSKVVNNLGSPLTKAIQFSNVLGTKIGPGVATLGRTNFTGTLEPATRLEVQVHHLISLGGWNEVLSTICALKATSELSPTDKPALAGSQTLQD
jgi:hypothetical protein